jgi:hypothetical protein
MKQVRNSLRSGALQTTAKGAIDQTESFVVATQALLATHRSIQEQRVAFMNTHFPYDLT